MNIEMHQQRGRSLLRPYISYIVFYSEQVEKLKKNHSCNDSFQVEVNCIVNTSRISQTFQCLIQYQHQITLTVYSLNCFSNLTHHYVFRFFLFLSFPLPNIVVLWYLFSFSKASSVLIQAHALPATASAVNTTPSALGIIYV